MSALHSHQMYNDRLKHLLQNSQHSHIQTSLVCSDSNVHSSDTAVGSPMVHAPYEYCTLAALRGAEQGDLISPPDRLPESACCAVLTTAALAGAGGTRCAEG